MEILRLVAIALNTLLALFLGLALIAALVASRGAMPGGLIVVGLLMIAPLIVSAVVLWRQASGKPSASLRRYALALNGLAMLLALVGWYAALTGTALPAGLLTLGVALADTVALVLNSALLLRGPRATSSALPQVS